MDLHIEGLKGDENKKGKNVNKPEFGPWGVLLLRDVRHLDVDSVVYIQERV